MSQLFQYKPLRDIKLEDPFFDSLRLDYEGFDAWYKRKADEGRKAFVLYGQQGLLAFIFLKSEIDERIEDVEPPLEPCRRLKVGTLKIEAHQTKLGERVLKIIFDQAILYGFEEIYLTSFPKHTSLIKLLETYGFQQIGWKGGELVLARSMTSYSGDIRCDYPRFSYYRSVVTSICTVREVKAKECWKNCEEFLKDVFPFSVFSREELTDFYQKQNFYVIHMLYNCALSDRVTRKSLIEEARIDEQLRWGFLHLTNEQFKYILDKGNVSKGLIID